VGLIDGPGPVKKARLDLKSHEDDSAEIAAALGDALDRYAAQPPEPPTAPALEAGTPDGAQGTLPPVGMPEPYRSGAAIPVGVRPTTAQGVAKSFFEVTLGADIYGRRFEYRNGISRSPSIDSRLQAVAARASGKIFPFAGEGPLGGIGIAAEYSSALFRTNPSSYSFAICVRIPMRSDARALVGASVGYSVASFPSVGTPNAELPGVTYRSIRPAVDVRVTLGPVSVLASTAFRAILDADAISTRFYNPRGYGFDAEVGAALMFAPRFEWRLVARYTRYLFAFTPPDGATFAAGDALDQWYGAQGSLAFVF
ncbi:MAG: hypothetical protein M3O46_01805, partial [Myxococcota bacterium]|nr:hypothetical protein [Myxococcota bacterium]